jgi:ECF sigma factor
MALLPASSNQVTQLLIRWSQGDNAACEKLFPLVYDELRRLARRCLAGERPGHTLQSTALVHEAYLRLVDRTVSFCCGGQRYIFKTIEPPSFSIENFGRRSEWKAQFLRKA